MLAGCSFDRGGTAATGEGALPGGPDAAFDAGASQAATDAAPPAAPHLLLTEVRAVAPATGSEFIELYNPGDAPVALDGVHLSDDGNYFQLPASVATGLPLPLDPLNDFIVRFPPGATVAAGAAITVAFDGPRFLVEYGVEADHALDEDMIVVAGSGEPALTNEGELVALFRWDGASDLVTDVDLVVTGNAPGPTNRLIDKSGQLVDGPDRGIAGSTYRPEAATLLPFLERTRNKESYKRLAAEASEVPSGGNGEAGHDETSEPTRVTWSQGGFTAPDPGVFTLPGE